MRPRVCPPELVSGFAAGMRKKRTRVYWSFSLQQLWPTAQWCWCVPVPEFGRGGSEGMIGEVWAVVGPGLSRLGEYDSDVVLRVGAA